MKKLTILTIGILSLVIGLAAACSPDSSTTITPTNTDQTKMNENSTTAETANNAPAEKAEEDAPANVKAAFPDAQSFTKQHKDIPADAIADIEKDTGAKVPDTDHHSFLAFSTTGGSRKQVGAATIVEAGGKEMVVIYENKEGKPYIKEVRADGVPAPFLAQFVGKGHDDKFDVKAEGVDDSTAKEIAKAIQIDALTMQMLYGAADNH